jgi:hypothetical protein
MCPTTRGFCNERHNRDATVLAQFVNTIASVCNLGANSIARVCAIATNARINVITRICADVPVATRDTDTARTIREGVGRGHLERARETREWKANGQHCARKLEHNCVHSAKSNTTSAHPQQYSTPVKSRKVS